VTRACLRPAPGGPHLPSIFLERGEKRTIGRSPQADVVIDEPSLSRLHAAVIDTVGFGLDRSINPPGIRASVRQMLAALEAVKPGASALVRPVEDAAIAAIVGTWPGAFDPLRASRLGFAPHEKLVDLVRAFIEDDLLATRHERGLPD